MAFRPTSDSPIRRPDLGAVAYEVLDNAPGAGFVADQVMPPFPARYMTASYPVIPKEALFNIYDTRRQSDGSYNSYDGEFERGWYETTDHGLTRRKDDRDLAIYKTEFDYELVITKTLMNDILRAKEYRVATLVMNPSNFTPVNAAVAWATAATATPVADVEAGKEVLRKKGVPANCVILPAPVLPLLKLTADVKDRVWQIFPDAMKSGLISIEMLKSIFDVPNILVAGALKNTAGTGLTATLDDIWGSQYIQVCRIAEGSATDVLEPCIGRQFTWNDGSMDASVIVEEYRDEDRRSSVIRVRHDSVEKFLTSYDDSGAVKSAISLGAGYLIDITRAS